MTRRMSRRKFVIVSLLLTILTTSAVAFADPLLDAAIAYCGSHQDGERVLFSRQIQGNAWMSYRLQIPAGGHTHLTLSYRSLNARRAVVWHRFEDLTGPSATQQPSEYRFAHDTGLVRVHHEGEEIPGRTVDFHASEPVIGCGWSYREAFNTVETRHTMFVAADGDTEVSFTLSGSPGTELLNETAGSEVFIHGEEDFTGGTSTVIGGPYWALPFVWIAQPNSVADIQGASASETVARQLFGFFESLDGYSRIGYDSPDGSFDGDHLYAWSGAAPGLYRFRIDKDSNDPRILVAGAEAVLA